MTNVIYTGVRHIKGIPVSNTKTAPLQDYIDWCAAEEAKIEPKYLLQHRRRIISDPKKLHTLVTMVHGGYVYKHIKDRLGCKNSTISKTLSELPPHLR